MTGTQIRKKKTRMAVAEKICRKHPKGLEVDGEKVAVRISKRSGFLMGLKKRHRQVRIDPLDIPVA